MHSGVMVPRSASSRSRWHAKAREVALWRGWQVDSETSSVRTFLSHSLFQIQSCFSPEGFVNSAQVYGFGI